MRQICGQDVIWPFNANVKTQAMQRFRHRDSGKQGEKRSLFQRQLGPQLS